MRPSILRRASVVAGAPNSLLRFMSLFLLLDNPPALWLRKTDLYRRLVYLRRLGRHITTLAKGPEIL